jgi:hypothetical protein
MDEPAPEPARPPTEEDLERARELLNRWCLRFGSPFDAANEANWRAAGGNFGEMWTFLRTVVARIQSEESCGPDLILSNESNPEG